MFKLILNYKKIKLKTVIQKDKSSHFHFAIGGKSFAVVRNEHKDLANKVNLFKAITRINY